MSCRCPEPTVERYRSRVSGPLLDRIDIRVELSPVPFGEWAGRQGPVPESSAVVRKRVIEARKRASARMGKPGALNAQLEPREIREHCRVEDKSLKLLESFVDKGSLSARGIDRMLRVARTIADLAGSSKIEEPHVAEALFYRGVMSER